MSTFFFTLGHGQGPYVTPLGHKWNTRGMLAVHATHEEHALALVNYLYGNRWSGVYDPLPDDWEAFFPAGVQDTLWASPDPTTWEVRFHVLLGVTATGLMVLLDADTQAPVKIRTPYGLLAFSGDTLARLWLGAPPEAGAHHVTMILTQTMPEGERRTTGLVGDMPYTTTVVQAKQVTSLTLQADGPNIQKP